MLMIETNIGGSKMRSRLINAFVFSFVTMLAVFPTELTADHFTNTEKTQEEILVVQDIYITIDFDGGHYYYVRLKSNDESLSSWELAREADFRMILKDNWKKGDEIVALDHNQLWNISKDSHYYFYSAGNWWPQRR